MPNWPKVLQVDPWGRRDGYACVRNPDYVTWWLSLVEDQVKSYPLDGLMFGSERNGPLGNVLGNGGFARDGCPYCFCSDCERAGLDRGIDLARARDGYLALYRLARGAGDPSGDSGFVAFLRLLLTYPEIMAWERLWHDGYQSLQTRARFVTEASVARIAEVHWLSFDGPARFSGPPPSDASTRARLIEFVAGLDALVVSHGCPRVDDEVLAAAPSLKLVGDLHGDRFALRIDVEAARRRGVWAVDTTNASSDPVAEWALALTLIGLRNAGSLFRRLVAGRCCGRTAPCSNATPEQDLMADEVLRVLAGDNPRHQLIPREPLSG